MPFLDPPIKPTTKRGRKSVDYESLYKMWIGTNTTAEEFLELYGLSAKSSVVQLQCAEWRRRAKDLSEYVKLETPACRDKSIPLSEATATVLDRINKWRLNQGEDDYLTANSLRDHIKLKLKTSLKMNEAGEFYSLLEDKEIASLAKSLMDIQRIQRLALGMSTENVGLAVNNGSERDSHIEALSKEVIETESVPRFIVEVNDNGKFKRPRPVRSVQNKTANAR